VISYDAAVTTDVRDASTDVGDVRVEMPPLPGTIPCGDYFCDASRMYCVRFVGGIAAGRRACYPLPAACVGRGDDCTCAPPDDTGCTACRVVTGADVTGIERDCPGPID
jgi:hypothetical protein